jgi:hypothetical protein
MTHHNPKKRQLTAPKRSEPFGPEIVFAIGTLACRVKTATIPGARPARRLAAFQAVGIAQLIRLVVPCQTPRAMLPRGRSTVVSRIIERIQDILRALP